MDPAVDFMRHAARLFVKANRGILELDFSIGSVEALEEWLGRVACASLPAAVLHSNAIAAGAYVGEVLVRAGKGSWTSGGGLPGVRLHAEPTVVFPIDKVGKRLTLGPEHDIRPFIAVAWHGVARGTMPRGAVAIISAAPDGTASKRATNV